MFFFSVRLLNLAVFVSGHCLVLALFLYFKAFCISTQTAKDFLANCSVLSDN